MQEKKLDLIFGKQIKAEQPFDVYKEEIVYWNSQNAEMLGYSKKENYSGIIRNLIRNQTGKLNQNVSLKVNFSSDLKQSFAFFDDQSLQKVSNPLGGLLTVVREQLKNISVFVESEQIRFEFTLDILTEKTHLDRGIENFANLFKLKTPGQFFNAVKYNVKTGTEGIILNINFANKAVEKTSEMPRQGKRSEKRNDVQTF